MARAAIDIPADYRDGVRKARERERNRIARFVLTEMERNWDIATAERRPMCADTGLPRYYVRAGNEAVIEGGFVALERALRRATADATASIPLRPNRVHPVTRRDHDNNVGIHAPEVTYAFEPRADGVAGIKRFFVDTLVEFGKRGLACQPAIVGLGLGGSKDTCVRLGKEAACLRVVGSRNPDPAIAALEEELTALGNYVGIGAMGFAGTSLVVATHIEVAYTHTGGPPVGPADLARLKLGDVVYISGVLYTARESVYRKVVEQGVDFPASVRTLTNVNFHCSPAATVRPDGTHAVEAVTATASFRFGKSMSRWFERSGARVVVGKAGLTELAYREWFVPHGAIYLTTVGYGMGAAYGRCIKRVVDVHWLAELGIAQALWVLEVERLGPFLVEGDREGKSLFAVANREINLRLEEVYRGLPPYAMGRFGETTARTDEII